MRSTTDHDCTLIQDDLAAYLHSELPPLSRVRVGWHLLHCAACRKELGIIKKVSTTLGAVEDDSSVFDAELRTKILSQLPETPAMQTLPPITRRSPLLAWSTLAVATCGVAAAVIIPLLQPRVTNTFNAASNQMISDEAYAPAASSTTPVASSSAGSTGSRGAGEQHLDGTNFAFKDGHVQSQEPRRARLENRIEVTENKAVRLQNGSTFVNGALRSSDHLQLTPYRRVHKEGSLAVEVEAIEEASDAVESTIKKAGGFVANNTLSTEKDGLKSAALEIRVPVKQFDDTIKAISSLGEVKAKRVQGEDITAQVSDANEENNVVAGDLRVKLEQYRKAKERAARKNKNVPDDWQQRAEIRQMRIQLAQVRARIEYLKKLSDFASLSVELREQPEFVSGGGLLNDMRNTSRSAYDSFLLAARLPLNLLIYILVYSPFWLPILIVWRYFLRPSPRRLPEP